MKTSASSILCAALLAATSAFAAVPQARITATIDNTQRAELPGTASPHAHAANDAGTVAPNTPLTAMTLVFSRTVAQQQALDALIAAQQTPGSAQYHHFLTPAQFGAQFGVADADIAKASAWLEEQGFTVTAVSPARDRITFSGNAAQVASAFGAELHNYTSTAGTHFAPSTALTVPSALASSVLTVANLSSFRPRPRVKFNSASAAPRYTSGLSGNVYLGPRDLGTIYDVNTTYNNGFNGGGQSIAVIGQSAIVPADITAFQTGFGYTAKPPIQVLVPNTGSSTVYTGDEAESDLDLEYTSTMAPGATIYFVYAGSSSTADVFTAAAYAVQEAIAPIISLSYGDCEPDLGSGDYAQLNNILSEAAVQGQTVVVAAGDSGSTDCWEDTTATTTYREALAADFPASSQYVTGMGGTEIPSADISSTYFTAPTGTTDVVSSAKSYVPEQTWNDDAYVVSNGYQGTTGLYAIDAGGGGTSIYTARPTWQTGVTGIPSGTFRVEPDLALLASNYFPGYIFCSSDETAWTSTQESSCTSGLRDSSTSDFTVAGGTSFAAPIFAGLVAVLNQAKGYTTGQGLLNQELYTLASSPTTYATAFHDINVANNGNECAAGTTYCSTAGAASYFTTAGYDEATGLGSIDFTNLVAAWPTSTATPTTATFTLAANPTAATVAPGSSTSTTITVTPTNGFTGTVNLTASGPSTLTNACFSLGSANVTGTAAVTSTITITTSVASCPTGTSPLVKTTTIAANTTPRTSHTTLATMAAASIFGLLFLSRRRKSLRNLRGAALIILLALTAAGAASLTGCSNKESGATPNTNPVNTNVTGAGTYTITITGTSGTDSTTSATATFTLTVS